MKKIFGFLTAAVALSMAVASCSTEGLTIPVDPSEETFTLTFHASLPPVTKATLTPEGSGENLSFKAAWEEGDALKVTIDNKDYIATWNGSAFVIENVPGEWKGLEKTVFAVYPAVAPSDGVREQDGIAYNSLYDTMECNGKTVTLDATDGGFLLPMKRTTAIYYFNLKSNINDDITAATLTIGGTTIKASYANLNAQDAVLWFNFTPGTYEALSLDVEAEGHVLSLTNTTSTEYEAGKLYSVVAGNSVMDEKWYADPHAEDNGWYLVKDVRALMPGDEIRIANAEKGVVASAFGEKTFFNKVDGTFENEVVNAPDAITITIGKDGTNWTMTTSEGVVGTKEAKAMTLNDDDASNTWMIEISADGIATIASTNESYGRILYNVSSPRFLNYTSALNASMLLPQIYKKYGTPEEQFVKKTPSISFSPTSVDYTLGDEGFEEPKLTCDSDGIKTWESSDENVATVDAEGNVTITATEAGSAIITVHFAESDSFNAGEASYELTVKEAPVTSEDKYVLVSSVSDLAVGDKVIIAAKDYDVAISTTQNTNNRGQAGITKKTDNTATISNDVQVFDIETGTATGTFSFKTNGGYIYAASSGSNYLKTESTKSGNSSWTIKIDSGAASIVANGSNTRNVLQYNQSSSLFACYSSASQKALCIYKFVQSDVEDGDDDDEDDSGETGGQGDGDTYVLCTSTSDLVAGAQYIIANGFSGEVNCISNESNNNNRKVVAATVSDYKIVVPSTSSIMTLTLGGSTGAWTLHTNNYKGTNGYLASAAASGSNNYCRVISDATTGTITFSGNAAVITLNPHTSRNILKYNTSSTLFACYSSGQAAIYLYKKN